MSARCRAGAPTAGVYGRARAAVLALAALLVPAAAGAEGQRFGDVVVSPLPALPGERSHGYLEHRFRIDNVGAAAHRVRLRLPPTTTSLSFGWVHLSREVLVAAGGSVEVALAQPPLPMWASAVEVRVDGRRAERPLPLTRDATFSPQPGRRALLASPLTSPEALPFDTAPQVAVHRAGAPPAAWSPSWLAYSGYEAVSLGVAELASTSAAVREALHRFVEAGGVLLVLGDGPAAALLGIGGAPRPFADGSAIASWPAGFGLLLVVPGPGLLTEDVEPVAAALEQAAQWWTTLPDSAGARRAVAVREPEVPVRGMFVAVLLFAFVVGPVNLFVLARRGRKMWILWTVPGLALLATAAVAAFALIGEGVVRERSSLSLTLLDQDSRRAITWAWSGFYSTLTPGDGLLYSAQTEVSPFLDGGPGGGVLGVDWTAEQRLVPGWMVARFPLHVATRLPALRRERLLLVRDAEGALVAHNALGAPLRRLLVADRDGYVWQAGAMMPGGRAPLTLIPGRSANGGPLATRNLLAEGLEKAVARLESEPHVFLPPGGYLAFLGGDPFVEPGLADARTAEPRAVVLGTLAEGEP